MAGKKEREETFERARKLLMDAVDTVLEIATIDRDGKKSERDAEATSSNPVSMTTSTSSISSPAVSEHKRLFGFKPSKAYSKRSKGKSKFSSGKSKQATRRDISLGLTGSN